ncbi:hypothetical protein I7I53_03678 [Histoplasma capsulatum var. duboisii H88]|uniref:Uncharacterized protein n=1 Tax=Ajellomyces capsulatus (strain H88) TaxID=544711 RepID=A0A8A1LTH6_AJEC8|nr:hypothetical protein I7I53_03678 [Histoplasma capsulatum var. duboisii H88]
MSQSVQCLHRNKTTLLSRISPYFAYGLETTGSRQFFHRDHPFCSTGNNRIKMPLLRMSRYRRQDYC